MESVYNSGRVRCHLCTKLCDSKQVEVKILLKRVPFFRSHPLEFVRSQVECGGNEIPFCECIRLRFGCDQDSRLV